jgi:Uma2 family endonuclease
VEIASRTTRLRDHAQKRQFYLRSGVAQYWIVDGERRTIRVVAPNADDVVVEHEMVWQPAGASAALTIDVAAYFREALG